ncbi:hypothetical protein BH23PLA1_BH23PLA1_33360 [soil metagenome]
MRLEDETLLSAYLDDELAPSDRRRVEAALHSDLKLLQKLMELANLRDLLAGLDRPGPAPDIVDQVLDRLSRRRQARREARRLAFRSGLVAAAAMLAALTLAPWSPWARHQNDRGLERVAVPPLPGPEPGQAGTEETAIPGRAIVSADGDRQNPQGDEAPRQATDEAPRPTIEPDFFRREQQLGEQRDYFRNLLDRPGVLRIVLEIPPGEHPEEVIAELDHVLASLVRKHPKFGRLQLGPEPLVDPDRPGEALIYSFLANTPERNAVVDRLETLFQGRLGLKPDRPEPEVAMMLADAGSLDVRLGTEGEILQDTSAEMNLLRDPVEGLSSLPLDPKAPRTRAGNPANFPSDPDEPRTVLIWVELPERP